MNTILRNGWHDVSRRVRVFVHMGRITRVETTKYDLDAALDDAAEFWGVPLDRVTPWLTDDGRDPEDENTGNNSKVTCGVEAQS